MRKTKLIILPTKCLNQLGFLLLFLSCPVIGDWGRIQPDTEMSQWSIRIDKEGSCGLVRNPPGIKDAAMPDGLMECKATDGERNNTSIDKGTAEYLKESGTTDHGVSSFFEIPVRESREQRRTVRSNRDQSTAERRIRTARREVQERMYRRETRSLSPSAFRSEDRRELSGARRNHLGARRNDRSRSLERSLQQREARSERYEVRQMSPDRRAEARRSSQERRVRVGDGRTEDVRYSRRQVSTRRERDGDERREVVLRRIENVQRRAVEADRRERSVQSRHERVKEQRATRMVREVERNVRKERLTGLVSADSRESRRVRDVSERRGSREERIMRGNENSERRGLSERRMEIQERRSVDLRRSSERERETQQSRRRQEERRLTREVRSAERADARRVAVGERRVGSRDSSLQRIASVRNNERRAALSRRTERDVRQVNRSDRMVRDQVSRQRENNREDTAERSARAVRRERFLDSRMNEQREVARREARRIETDLSRRQDVRIIERRADKSQNAAERRDAQRVLVATRDHREKLEKILAHDRIAHFGIKSRKAEGELEELKKWEFLEGIKNWFGQKNNDEWGANYGDFTKTCLMGAAVYLLTTRQVKSI